MNIILASASVSADMILNGTKPLEFRTKHLKGIRPGETIFFYQIKKRGGCGMVVGHCTLVDTIPVLRPAFGCYNLMDYFLRNIKKNSALADHVQSVMQEYAPYLEHQYRYGYILKYVFSPENLKHIKEHLCPIDTWKQGNATAMKIINDIRKGEALISSCDEWLGKIGFYNDYGEVCFNYAYVLKNPVRYETPLPISRFTNSAGMHLNMAPQSCCYTQTNTP